MEAAKADNHSDISPFRINRLRAVWHLIIAHARNVELSTSIMFRNQQFASDVGASSLELCQTVDFA
jgi:hypothetical protein